MDAIEKIEVGNLIIYKNNGIGVVSSALPTIFKEQEVSQIKLKILFPVNNDSNFTNNAQACSFLLLPEMSKKLRKPLSREATVELFEYIMEFKDQISMNALLEEDFKIDLFQYIDGMGKLIVLHDYLYHALINSQQICSNYFFMYENAIKHLALELSLHGNKTEKDCQNILEMALFLNHAKRNCKQCIRKREDEYNEVKPQASELFKMIFDFLENEEVSKEGIERLENAKRDFDITILEQ